MTGGKDDGTQGRWSDDLPGDLLGTIYRRCSSSFDRRRFAAVCKSWRAAASWLQPNLPLLLPSTGNGRLDREARAYSPEDGRVLAAPLPWFPYGKRIVGSYDGGWVAAAIGCRIDIVNLFTCAWALHKEHLSCSCSARRREETSYKFSPCRKIIFSQDPASTGCTLAAMMSTRCIVLSRFSGPGGGWTTTTRCFTFPLFQNMVDIAFCNGDLYGLLSNIWWPHTHDLLYKLAIVPDKRNAPQLVLLEKITIQPPPVTFDRRYIFELGGKLATVVVETPASRSSSGKATTFRVLELSRGDNLEGTWAEVASLGDHALFLGPGCCKAVHMPAVTMRGEVERNCVYYSEQEEEHDPECLAKLNLGSCTVCCYHSSDATIMSRGYHYPGRNTCAWIFPPHL